MKFTGLDDEPPAPNDNQSKHRVAPRFWHFSWGGASLGIVILALAGIVSFPLFLPYHEVPASIVDDWDIHVQHIEYTSTLVWSTAQPSLTPEHAWMLVYLHVARYGNNGDTFGYWRMSLRDESGKIWDSSTRGEAIALSQFRGLSSPDVWLNPGQSMTCIVVFDAAIDVTHTTVLFDGQEVH